MNEIVTKEDFERVVCELNKELKRRYHDFEGITFFGSRNRDGEAFAPGSDFDIVVLFSEKPHWKKENEVLDLIYEKELEYDIIIDAKVYQRAEIKKQNTPFRVNVYREGMFYGA
ncbi:MAG: nucleotidyltransferase domain-containing protein [Candidatus Aminicenantes bacterium]|nr:nucleotidyltransferase domain-containing protein [Candidatus Aminicenantes bacterium]